MGFAGGTASICPHGMSPQSCEICRVLGNTPTSVPARRNGPRPARREFRKLPVGLGAMAVAAVVAVVVLVQVVAVVSMVVRLAQLIGVAAIAGYVGWRLGVVSGRHDRS